jgi:probable rRNA maturation factor
MKVTIINEQKSLRIVNKKFEKYVKTILKEEKVVTDEVILHFVDANKIKDLHFQYFKDSSITDCISFSIDRPNKKKIGYNILGEAFICTDAAISYSKEHKVDSYDELILYVIHSILHLIGYDDINKKDIEIMRKKENYYLSLFKEKIDW